ncbi:hypothetical protein, partial [Xanthomonas fragariae]|uniref:hypothetical protein n=1 Tax=Xanthomonas fragariae TaxID=48664 RepID=UPI001F298756
MRKVAFMSALRVPVERFGIGDSQRQQQAQRRVRRRRRLKHSCKSPIPVSPRLLQYAPDQFFEIDAE